MKKGQKVTGRHAAGLERPHVWKIGSDAGSFKHSMYMPWQQAKAQAKFRGEDFELEFEDYYEFWQKDWDNRGRLPDNMCMTRIDSEGAWSRDNCLIITRREHLQNQGFKRKGAITYKKLRTGK